MLLIEAGADAAVKDEVMINYLLNVYILLDLPPASFVEWRYAASSGVSVWSQESCCVVDRGRR